tara:strand:- start:235 stop:1305 length:1071 start_codon:yes stop_codon:yes gene_type:complete
VEDNKSGVTKKSSKGEKSKAKSAKKATQSKSVAKKSPVVRKKEGKKSSKKAELLRDKAPKKESKIKEANDKKTTNGEASLEVISGLEERINELEDGAQDNSKDNKNSTLGDQQSGFVPSKIINKAASSHSEEKPTLKKSYNEDALFLCGEHKSSVENVVSCLKSSTPFCFLSSEKKSYVEYYKEIIIDLLRYREKIKLLYFDPKFGDDLSVIINREIEDIDMSFIGSSKVSELKKILIIDNEDFSGHLDWELMDSLRLELSSANIGVLSIKPNFLAEEVESKVASITSNFSCFDFLELTKNELKELNEYISAHSEKDQLLEIVEKLFADNTEKEASTSPDDNASIWRKARNFIFRK